MKTKVSVGKTTKYRWYKCPGCGKEIWRHPRYAKLLAFCGEVGQCVKLRLLPEGKRLKFKGRIVSPKKGKRKTSRKK